ncbi:hypothetical protein FBU30_002518 [Linnemannia zychae]|nr:hypothetical protein FBU30_002518 [Linnemannia zychae]
MSVINSPTAVLSPQQSTIPQQYHTASSQHDLATKRSATWRYLQRVHQGGMVLYNTALLSEADLRQGYPHNDEKMQRRTMQYFMLGSSLATILEIPNQADCLKALLVVIQEYEYFIASESKSKMMFLRAAGRKTLLEGKSFEETGEYSQLDVRPLKILATVSKELEMMARDVMVDELNSMDPLGGTTDDWGF